MAAGAGIEGRFHSADLPKYVLDLRDLLDQRILCLQYLHRFGKAGRRIKCRHVEPAALVQGNPVVGSQPRQRVFEVDVAGNFVEVGSQPLARRIRGPQHCPEADPRSQAAAP